LRPISRADIERLRELTERLASPLSEYRAANLYLFRGVHDYRWAEGPVAAIAGRAYDGAVHLTPLAPLSRAERLEMAAGLGAEEVLFPLCASEVEGLDAAFDPDDSDYLYDASDLATLRGEARKAKRNLRNQFRRTAAPRDEPLGAHNRACAIEALDGWLADVDRPLAETDYAACREALDLQAELGLEGLISYTGEGRPAGFLLASVVRGAAVVHFAKGRRSLAGVYPHLFSRFAEGSAGRFAQLNFEQDLGKPGFRQAKRAYGPVELLSKHRLTPAAARRALGVC
jgi:hypothetical protein